MITLQTAMLVLVPVLALGAQDARLAARFPPSEAVAISLLVDSAVVGGLPREPLILRALEGAAKGVPGPQVRAVLARFRDAMMQSREILGRSSDATELATAAAALLSAVPISRLRELRSVLGSRSMTVPLGAYLDMVAGGAAPDAAWRQVSVLARRRAGDSEFIRLAPGLAQEPRQR